MSWVVKHSFGRSSEEKYK